MKKPIFFILITLTVLTGIISFHHISYVSAHTANQSLAANAHPQSVSNVTLEEINLGLSGEQILKDWYEAQSSNTGDNTYFGAYVTLPVGSDLYIGLGSARPAEDSGDGAYFAKFDGTNLTGIDEPNEQGFHEMIYDGSLVHIACTDPMSPDDWTAGNHYTYSPGGAFTKYRDAASGLKNVYHTWGLWKSDSTLYAAVSAHEGDNTTFVGQIFTSTNNGYTWTLTSDLGGYRAYDIIGFDDDLYAIHNDVLGGVLTMTKNTDGGINWTDIITDGVRRVHMLEFD
ncbi:MAG: sialidase family protein, partial [Chloroflexota bacterium]